MKTVWITGASSGIGEFLAYEFSKLGFRVALTARRKDKLERVHQKCIEISKAPHHMALEGDVRKPDQMKSLVDRIISEFGRLDFVIANAGFGVAGSFEKLSPEDFARQFETNVFGVLHTVYAGLPPLKISRGVLAILGSVNSYVAQPRKAPYCMSKFAVRALAESLYSEFRSLGVQVSLIAPGMVESEIRNIDNFGAYHSEVSRPPAWITLSTDQAAKQIVRGLIKRKREIIVTHHGKIGIWMARHLPGALLWILSKFNPQGYRNKLRP